MSKRFIVVIVCVLSTTIAARPAQVAKKPKARNLTEHRLDMLLRGLNRNDVTAQLTSVVQLEHAVDNATPQDLILLRNTAVPMLKACIRRESIGRTGRPEIAAIMRRILKKILRGDAEPDPPTDLTARSQTTARLIAQLSDKDELVKRRALVLLRRLKAMGTPALPAARHIAANTTDKLTRQVAQATVRAMVSELWFAPGLARAEAAPPDKKVDPLAIRKQLQDLVEKLIERLNKPPDPMRMRAMRQLAGMKASADAAIGKLTRIATDRKESRTIRKTAATAARTINTATAEAEKWRRWQEKKKTTEARNKRHKTPTTPE